eukprot:TRINITY_DN8898_c0_g3_i1.p1 TRINITY_DN8898_c0_g3~~TRINITY_DN8898_c0_g3_i1.p1  ORF type:complete len:266 (+),score=27.50 TRINITY_DN8898_c0_g3_i1:105-902(+)
MGGKQPAAESELPADVFRNARSANGDVVPGDIAEHVGEFTGGLVEHLNAMANTVLDKELKDVAKKISELDRKAGDKPVVTYQYVRKQDAVLITRPRLQKAIPQCLIGYTNCDDDTTWHIALLRVAPAARDFVRQITARARAGFHTHYATFKFEGIPVCAIADAQDTVCRDSRCHFHSHRAASQGCYYNVCHTQGRDNFDKLGKRLGADLSAALTAAGLPSTCGTSGDVDHVRDGSKTGTFVVCSDSLQCGYDGEFGITLSVAARW